MADEVLRKLENSPLPEVIKNLAVAISEAQIALDRNSCLALKAMAAESLEIQNGKEVSMLELGLVPSFYHFTETNIEARVAFTMMQSRETSVSAKLGVPIKIVTASIEASYTSKYSFQAEGSSVVSTKVVSVPPPAALTQLITASREADLDAKPHS